MMRASFKFAAAASIYYLLLLLTTSTSSCNAAFIQQEFLQCMAIHSTSKQHYLHTSTSPSYTTLLQSSQQNPRWLNSSSSSSYNKPLLIVTPYTPSQIQATVLCTRKHRLEIRVRSGGHDYEGLSYISNHPFVIIDLINLRSVNISLQDETAWVHSGATLGELYYAIAHKSPVHGFPAGLCPSVGIGGHFSGGGFGTMLRKHGLAADNVLDAYLVDANASLLDRKAMGEDLFWAIRGGGGASFGVIVSWKIKLVQVPPVVTVFNIDKKLDQGATKLVHRWQYVADKLPDHLFIRVIVQDVDSNNKSQKKTVQATFQSLFLGKTDELIPMMKKSFPELDVQAENCIEMSWIRSVMYFTGYQKGQPLEVLLNRTVQYKSNFKAKSDFVKEPIPESGLEGVWKKFLEEEVVFMIMDPFGGRMNEIPETALPFPHRKGNIYNIQYMVKWGSEAPQKHHLQWMTRLYQYMTPYVSHSPRAAYLNYRDLDLGLSDHQDGAGPPQQASIWGHKYFKGNFPRLVQAKTKADPENYFRNEQSIPPHPTSHVIKN